jgi:hypothetical protein
LLFTLEFPEQQARKYLELLGVPDCKIVEPVQILTSDHTSAEYIIQHMSGPEAGAIAFVDFLVANRRQTDAFKAPARR